jgi:hypothetical protein
VLAAVVALSADEAWAVGSVTDADGLSRPLVERWDGSSWAIAPQLGLGDGTDASLSGVTATASNDVWAVGGVRSLVGPRRTLVLHWDGSRWSVVPSPGLDGQPNALTAISATAPDDAWAVGTAFTADGRSRSLLEHWNGIAWSVAPTSSPGSGAQALGDVATWSNLAGGAGAWAVGFAGASARTERWDGTAWAAAPIRIQAGMADLRGASALGQDDVWVVGGRLDPATHAMQALVGHWDGSTWSVAPSVGSGDHSERLQDVAVLAGAGWAVGHRASGDGQPQTLILRRCAV